MADQWTPNWPYGYVPTAGQWNAAFGTKQDALGYTPLNQAGGTMTGPLVTVQSTTTSAGFSILPGAAPTTPNNGDVWITSSGLFYQVGGTTIGPLNLGNLLSFGTVEEAEAATIPGYVAIIAVGGTLYLRLNSDYPYFGDEEITNGDFSSSDGWTLGTGWSIDDNEANASNTGTNTLQQAFGGDNGTSYFIETNVTAVGDGDVLAFIGSATTDAYNEIGMFQSVIVAAGSAFIGLSSDSNFTGSVGGLSARAVPGTPIQTGDGQWWGLTVGGEVPISEVFGNTGGDTSGPLTAISVDKVSGTAPGAAGLQVLSKSTIATILSYLGAVSASQITVVSSSETFNFNAKTKFAIVEVLGGGGGGGTASGSSTASSAGGGGGAGGYARKLVSGVSSATITIGSAGSSASAGGNTSYSDGTNSITCNGGSAGSNGTSSTAGQFTSGGAGGTATGGDINFQGQKGSSSISLGSNSFSIAWYAATGGRGGSSVMGASGDGNAAAGATGGATVGSAATLYGSGGQGGASTNGGGSAAGGAGTAGLVIITEFM